MREPERKSMISHLPKIKEISSAFGWKQVRKSVCKCSQYWNDANSISFWTKLILGWAKNRNCFICHFYENIRRYFRGQHHHLLIFDRSVVQFIGFTSSSSSPLVAFAHKLEECVTNCLRLLHVKVNWKEIHQTDGNRIFRTMWIHNSVSNEHYY